MDHRVRYDWSSFTHFHRPPYIGENPLLPFRVTPPCFSLELWAQEEAWSPSVSHSAQLGLVTMSEKRGLPVCWGRVAGTPRLQVPPSWDALPAETPAPCCSDADSAFSTILQNCCFSLSKARILQSLSGSCVQPLGEQLVETVCFVLFCLSTGWKIQVTRDCLSSRGDPRAEKGSDAEQPSRWELKRLWERWASLAWGGREPGPEVFEQKDCHPGFLCGSEFCEMWGKRWVAFSEFRGFCVEYISTCALFWITLRDQTCAPDQLSLLISKETYLQSINNIPEYKSIYIVIAQIM